MSNTKSLLSDEDRHELIKRQAMEIEWLRTLLSELADLMDDVVTGSYKPDSFTTQPARQALKEKE